LAHIIKTYGAPPRSKTTEEPLFDQKEKKFAILNPLIIRLAYVYGPQKPDVKRVWKEIKGYYGPYDKDSLFNNHSIEVMDKIIDWLKKKLGDPSG
jgi:hypothetical protein